MFQFPGFPQTGYWFTWVYVRITIRGFPHSDICGSKVICTLPQLIAACHVLHRLLVPRHPPYALSHLTFGSLPDRPASLLLIPRLHIFICALRLGIRAPCISLHKLRLFFSELPELSKLSGLLLKNSSLWKIFLSGFFSVQIVMLPF